MSEPTISGNTMSGDTGGGIQAPIAPTTTTTEATGAPAPAPTTTAATPPANAREALARIRSGQVASVAPSPAVITEQLLEGQPRGPDGKFVAKPAGDEPAAPQQDTTPQTAAEAVAERVRIALEDGHPLRERGFTELPFDVPKEHEEIARYLANQPVKKRDFASAQEQARQAQAQAMEAQAEAAFWRENTGKVLTPEFYAKYADIKQTYGEADAERYRRAVLAEAQDQLTEQVGQTRAQQAVLTTAQQFRAAALEDAQQRFPGWTQGEMERAFQAYGAWISATGATAPKADDWYMIATPLYEGSAAGQTRRQQEHARIASEAVAKATEAAKQREQEALQAAADGRARNPLGALPNVQTGLSVPGASTGPRNAREAKELIAQRARGY